MVAFCGNVFSIKQYLHVPEQKEADHIEIKGIYDM